jgi:hypothetical protein
MGRGATRSKHPVVRVSEPQGMMAPDAADIARSRRLADLIAADSDAAGGWISFAEYMQHALYAPGLGYYAAGSTPFGEDGDFVTAPELSPLFAATVAAAIDPVLRWHAARTRSGQRASCGGHADRVRCARYAARGVPFA